jgi:hypothetical protein
MREINFFKKDLFTSKTWFILGSKAKFSIHQTLFTKSTISLEPPKTCNFLMPLFVSIFIRSQKEIRTIVCTIPNNELQIEIMTLSLELFRKYTMLLFIFSMLQIHIRIRLQVLKMDPDMDPKHRQTNNNTVDFPNSFEDNSHNINLNSHNEID